MYTNKTGMTFTDDEITVIFIRKFQVEFSQEFQRNCTQKLVYTLK